MVIFWELLSVMFSSVWGLKFPDSFKLGLCVLPVRCWSDILTYQPFSCEVWNLGFELLLGLSLNFYVSRLFCFFVSAAMRFELVKYDFKG